MTMGEFRVHRRLLKPLARGYPGALRAASTMRPWSTCRWEMNWSSPRTRSWRTSISWPTTRPSWSPAKLLRVDLRTWRR